MQLSVMLVFFLCPMFYASAIASGNGYDMQQPNKKISLNGVWDVALSDKQPTVYKAKAPIPGIISMAKPKIDIDFHATTLTENVGYDYVWYRYKFNIDEAKYSQALLKIRAKYNALIFLNGQEIGYDHHSTYSHAEFDLSKAINFFGENELIVRVGSWNTASSPSKENSAEWWRNSRSPGIWDDVWIDLEGDVSIKQIQIVPETSLGKTMCNLEVWNKTGSDLQVKIVASIWDDGKTLVNVEKQVVLKGEKKYIDNLTLNSEMLEYWTPGKEGNPKLYTLNVKVKDDETGKILYSKDERFGYRNITVEGKDVKLNGNKIFFRAENIAYVRALNRWEDVMFDEDWIRQFIRSVIQDHNFNYIRFHLGHAYSKWYAIADEEGLMIQDEWRYMHDDEPEGKDKEEAVIEFWRWIKQNVNHPSIVTWDQENEGNVRLKDLILDIRAYDPTRLWGEDDFNAHHVYDYSENIIDQPEFSQSPIKPSTVLESCRLWTNEFGLLEPKEDFKTSRTASGWGIFYYNQDIIGQLLSDIHADIGTFYRSERTQAWAPFALLSGWVNGQNFFLGNIADSLNPQPNLEVLKRLNEPVGLSINMLQAREWYKDKALYNPNNAYEKEIFVWNDFEGNERVEVNLYLKDEKGNIIDQSSKSLQIKSFETVKLKMNFNTPKESGCYYLEPILSINGKVVKGVERRIMVANMGDQSFNSYLGFGGVREVMPNGESVICNFLGFDPERKLSQTIINTVGKGLLDKLSFSEKEKVYTLQTTVYQSKTQSILTTTKIDSRGKILSSNQSLVLNYVDLPIKLKESINKIMGTVPVDESRITMKEGKSEDVYDIRVVGSDLRYRLVLSKNGELKKKEIIKRKK